MITLPWRSHRGSSRRLNTAMHLLASVVMMISMFPIVMFTPAAASIPCLAMAGLSAWISWPHQGGYSRSRGLVFFFLSLPIIALAGVQLLQISSKRELIAIQILLASSPLLALMKTTRGARTVLCLACANGVFSFGLWQGVSWGTLGAVSVMASLAAFQAVEEFASHTPARPWGERWQQIRRLLILALPPSLLLFFALPHMHFPTWSFRATTGVADIMQLGDTAVYSDPTPVLRVRYRGAAPRESETYFRSHTFWFFDGKRWSGGMDEGSVVASRADPATTRWSYDMERLEAGMAATALDWPRWSADSEKELTVSWASDGSVSWVPGLRLHHMAAGPAPVGPPALSPDTLKAGLGLPDVAPRARQVGAAWRDLSPRKRLVAIQRWMEGQELVYNLDPPSPAGHDRTDFFLFEGKQGYCQDFSSAFVVLARSAGLPARVVVGYQGADYNSYGKFWLVRRSNAHAWAEVWLSGSGWIRVDPTTLSSGEVVQEDWAKRMRESEWWKRLQSWAWELREWLSWDDWSMRGQFLFLMGLAALGSVVAALFLWFGRLRSVLPLPERAWRELVTRLVRLGIHRQRHEDPVAFGARVAPGLDPASQDRLRIALAQFSAWRYGSSSLPEKLVAKSLRAVRPRRAKPPRP